MPVPVAETPPHGLDAYWLGCWRHALKVLKAQGSWAWEQKPLLDEYVFALIAAQNARAEEEPTRWDKHAKRASMLADQLLLTPISRKKAGVKADGEAKRDEDPFAGLDEISQAREARANGA